MVKEEDPSGQAPEQPLITRVGPKKKKRKYTDDGQTVKRKKGKTQTSHLARKPFQRYAIQRLGHEERRDCLLNKRSRWEKSAIKRILPNLHPDIVVLSFEAVGYINKGVRGSDQLRNLYPLRFSFPAAYHGRGDLFYKGCNL